MVKTMNKAVKKKKDDDEKVPQLTKDQELLTEIKDLLSKKE
jgi:large-conductance mechanosensitive channel